MERGWTWRGIFQVVLLFIFLDVFFVFVSWLLGFSASCWFILCGFWWLFVFGFFASSAFPVPLRQVVFWLFAGPQTIDL